MEYWMNELCHHGILGQKWGIRRYQNEDGSLTPAGKERYRKYDESVGAFDHDYVENAITNRMDSLARKSEKYEEYANKILNNKASRIITPDIAEMYYIMSKKAIDKMNAGGAMLKAYRSLDEKSQDKIRDDTNYNFQIRRGITKAATKDMNKKEARQFKKNAKAYKFNYWEYMGKLK